MVAAAATELGIDGWIPSQSSLQFQNSISTKPKISIFPISNGELPLLLSNDQVELVSIKSTTYTSLKDMLLPAQSPPTTQSYYEIPIKNRLVQLAAWAYLQPMSNSSENRDRNIFRGLCVGCPVNCVNDQVDGCFVFMNEDVFPIIKRAFGGILRKITGEEENIGI